jgi:hypothetical protein
MTEASSKGPSGSDDDPTGPIPPTGSSPDPIAAAPDQPEQVPHQRRSGRSNEFYLALAGIAATVVVGLVGGWLTYQASTRQIEAESDRAALSFNREQRKTAYTEYLNALFDLDGTEYDIRYERNPSLSGPLDSKQLEDQYKAYIAAKDRLNRASSAVLLLASRDVADARAAISDDHSRRYFQIDDLIAAVRIEAPRQLIEQQRLEINLASPELEQRFVSAAQKDLGLTE